MRILTNFVAADEDECAAIGESARPADRWSGIERQGIDTAKIATLHCLLTGDEFEAAVAACEPLYVSDEGAFVVRIADEVMERLAALDEDELALVGEELAATAEFEMDAWDGEEVQALLMELGDLVRLAESQGQAVFAWIHPLQA